MGRVMREDCGVRGLCGEERGVRGLCDVNGVGREGVWSRDLGERAVVRRVG